MSEEETQKPRDKKRRKEEGVHLTPEPWPEQGAHKHVVLINPDTGKEVYITQKDWGKKIFRLLMQGWEIVLRDKRKD